MPRGTRMSKNELAPYDPVIITSTRTGRKKVYHTEQCRAVKQSKNWYVKQYRHAVGRNLCSYCSGTAKVGGSDGFLAVELRGGLYCRDCWVELMDGEDELCGFCRRAELVFSHPRDEPVCEEDRLEVSAD